MYVLRRRKKPQLRKETSLRKRKGTAVRWFLTVPFRGDGAHGPTDGAEGNRTRPSEERPGHGQPFALPDKAYYLMPYLQLL